MDTRITLGGPGLVLSVVNFLLFFLKFLSAAALPIDFPGKLKLLRTVHIPAASHGVEASPISRDALRKMQTAFVRSV